jgi:hypothetical protein
LVYLLVFHTYINEMHGSRSKIPSKKSRPYIYVKFLALLGAPYIYDINRLRVNRYLAFPFDIKLSIFVSMHQSTFPSQCTALSSYEAQCSVLCPKGHATGCYPEPGEANQRF